MALGRPNNRGPWLKDARQPRHGETIGGGYFVFRRGDGSGRIRPAQFPFEYDNLQAAQMQAAVHAAEQPGYRFDIVHVVSSVSVPASPTTEESERTK